MTAGTPDGPTLGRIAYEERLRIKGERLHYAPQPDYDALSDDLRAEWEAAGAAAGAHAIARLDQPAELGAALVENVRLRKAVRKLLGLFGKPDGRRMCQADVTAETLERYAAEAGVGL